jgi:ABC-2 type transport system ATP-binding protein
VHFDVDTAETDAAMRILVAGRIRSLSATPPTLEELFLRHYGSSHEQKGGRQQGRHEVRVGAQETAGAR